MKTNKQSFESGDFVEITFLGLIEEHDPHSNYPYRVTFSTSDSSEKFEGWTLQMKGSNLKPMNFGAYPWRLRSLAVQALTTGFLMCGCVLSTSLGHWITFSFDIGIIFILILSILNHLSYFKKHYEEIY
jgi:hypothetical protein